MITLHHLNNSRSTRIIWLLEELRLDYELVKYERRKDRLAPDLLKKAFPLGKAPILQDGDITLAESGAIIEYLLTIYDKQGELKPETGSAEWRAYLFWLHSAEGSAMPPLVMQLVFSEINNRAPFLIKPITKAIAKQVQTNFITPNVESNLALIEKTLAENEWFAGKKLSGADIQMSFVIEALAIRANSLNLPNAMSWLKRVRSRPAYQVALEKGGELELG